jgi:hypothetical protein
MRLRFAQKWVSLGSRVLRMGQPHNKSLYRINLGWGNIVLQCGIFCYCLPIDG